MQPAITTALILLALAAPSLHAGPGDVVGQGHILVGTPTTALQPDPTGLQSFYVDLGNAPKIRTSTVDNGGLGYDLDVYFYDANDDFVDVCSTPAPDETCQVPNGATQAEIAAFQGVDLDVTVLWA